MESQVQDKKELAQRIDDRSATIGIVGLGYVGLPLLLRCCEVGYRVTGFDLNKEKINQLLNGKSFISHIPDQRIQLNLNKFEVTEDFSKASESDVLILCLPTPLTKYREPDLSFILDAMDSLLPYFRSGQLVCLESTTYPGTTDEELAPRILSKGFNIGTNIFLTFSPEREDPGNENFTTHTIPKVVGGYSLNCLEIGVKFYGSIVNKVVPVSSTRAAEMTKILENVHRAVNIGLVNEMKIVADKMGIDIHEVIQAAATKPFGFVAYQPGPGLGGHCIPIDPYYLTWKAREYGIHTRFVELAGEINDAMPEFVISKVTSGLNGKKKSIMGSRILILGLAYKKNIDDMRESPSIYIMNKLGELGADVAYSDPYVPVFSMSNRQPSTLWSTPISKETLESYDCIVLATDHDIFDYQLIKDYSKLIVDCRGKYTPIDNLIIKA